MAIRQKRLRELAAALDDAVIVGGAASESSRAADTVLTGVAFDSRRVEPGFLFIAVPGEKFDGHSFIRDVVTKGAAAVVVQTGREAEFADLNVPLIAVADPRGAMPKLACAFYDNPTAKLHLVGVTGTNGKTTTALMMESIARAAGDKTGYVGTLGFGINGEIFEGERTTPEAIDLQAFFAQCVEEGVTSVAIEVASHALVLGRTEGCLFDVAVFTNLTQDHLDYHRTMEAYRDAKGLLFGKYGEEARAAGKTFTAVLNYEDEAALYYLQETLSEANRKQAIGYAPSGATTVEKGIGPQPDITPQDVKLAVDHIRYTATTPVGEVQVGLGFGGTFNVANSLAAIGYGVARGLKPEVIEEGLRICLPVPGRFQPVKLGQDYAVLVDYAHTPDGLENVLRSARPLTTGRLITVFGCGGNRDKTKRPLMGKLALELSDIAIVTSDNPRREDPEAILDDIVVAMKSEGATVYREVDRRKAIALAVSLARTGDTVVIAGKGHETYQIIGEETFPFDDVAVAQEEIEKCSAR